MTSVASEGSRRASAYIRLFTRWIGIASVLLSALIFAAQIFESLTLPDCESERASTALLAVAREAQIEAVSVEDPQGLASAQAEVSCRATLAVNAGATIAIRYRFFWEGWTQKIEITGVDG